MVEPSSDAGRRRTGNGTRHPADSTEFHLQKGPNRRQYTPVDDTHRIDTSPEDTASRDWTDTDEHDTNNSAEVKMKTSLVTRRPTVGYSSARAASNTRPPEPTAAQTPNPNSAVVDDVRCPSTSRRPRNLEERILKTRVKTTSPQRSER